MSTSLPDRRGWAVRIVVFLSAPLLLWTCAMQTTVIRPAGECQATAPGQSPHPSLKPLAVGGASTARFTGIPLQEYQRLAAILDAPGRLAAPVEVWLYRDNAHYSNCLDNQRHMPSRSRYESASRQLHIPASAPAASWRHEWVHVLLSEGPARLPYWLHEGLALLFEESPGWRGAVSVPERFRPYRQAARERLPAAESMFAEQQPAQDATDLALIVYFCAYLKERGHLYECLQSAGRNPQCRPSADFRDWPGWRS